MAKPDKKTVLNWYRDLKVQLKAEGIDVTNPKDLIRIKSYYFYENDNRIYPGIRSEQKGEKKFAFMPRKKGAQEKMVDYLSPEPPKPTEEQQADLESVYMEQKDAKDACSSHLKELEIAYKKDKSDEVIKEIKDRIPKAEKKADLEFQKYNELLQECFSEYNSWAIGNQKLFDEEEDYEQIFELYNQASQGLLYFDAVNGEPRDYKQILVTDTGKACFSKSSIDDSYRNVFPDAMFTDKINEPEKVEEFEKKYGEIQVPKSLDEMYPDEPVNVPKPGAWSWFKRIITLGINKSDFVKYERHEERLQSLAAYNEQCYDTMFRHLDEEVKKEVPDNVLNPGKVVSNRYYVTFDAFTPQVAADPEKGIYSTTLQICEMNNSTYLEIEAHENPASFDDKGNRVKEASKEYWTKKGQIQNPENAEKIEEVKQSIKKEQPERLKRLAKKEIARNYDRIHNDKKYKENMLEEGRILINKHFPNATKESVWLKDGLEGVMTKIGKLYGGGEKEGMKVISSLLVLNQTIGRDGKPNKNERAANSYITNEIKALIQIAEHPELLKDVNMKKHIEIGAEALKTPYNEMRAIESAAALYNENSKTGSHDIESVNAVIAMFVSWKNEQLSPGYGFYRNPNSEDIRVAKEGDIKEVCKMGNFLRIAQKGLIDIQKDKQKEVPELDVKKPLNIGL